MYKNAEKVKKYIESAMSELRMAQVFATDIEFNIEYDLDDGLELAIHELSEMIEEIELETPNIIVR